MHGLQPNNLASVASSVEEAYRFAGTPTLAVPLVDYRGGHQHDRTCMAQTTHVPQSFLTIGLRDHSRVAGRSIVVALSAPCRNARQGVGANDSAMM